MEVHVFKEVNGKFTPTEDFRTKDESEGFAWLKGKGYKTANVVKMDYTEYGFKNGTVGLYLIDNFLHSVILNYPPGEHEEPEKEFTPNNAERLETLYN